MNPRISIIVPCYNGEKYLKKCVDSLMNQTLTEGVEYLFINDGSTDNTLSLLKEMLNGYPTLLPQVRLINNRKNLGISKTRKIGISEANGMYIAWVDCDDWVEPTMIESLWNASNNGEIDIVVQNVIRHVFDKGKESLEEWHLYKTSSPREALRKYYTIKHVPWGLPFQFSKKSLLQKVCPLVKDVNIMEDTILLIYLFSIAKSAIWLEKPYYHYRAIIGGESLTNRNYKTKEEWKMQKVNIESVIQYLRKLDNSKDYELSIDYIKWHWKLLFRESFDNSWDYWKTYRECYRNINKYYTDSFSTPLKVWLKYNIYPLYWLREGRYIKFVGKKLHEQ